jgi:hypothetical protein
MMAEYILLLCNYCAASASFEYKSMLYGLLPYVFTLTTHQQTYRINKLQKMFMRILSVFVVVAALAQAVPGESAGRNMFMIDVFH